MSFPKAKINRFNETSSTTPSPADYNVELRSHVPGAIIPKSGRFADLRSPASSESSQSNVPSLFRTPKPPRKLKSIKVKPVELFHAETDVEALREKTVECNNKNQYIRELIDYIEDIKLQLSNLKKEKTEVETQLLASNEEQNNTIKNIETAHQQELKALKEGIIILINKTEVVREEYKQLKKLQESLVINFKASFNEIAQELNIIDKHAGQLEFRSVILQNEHVRHLQDVRKKHALELEEMHFEMLKTVAELQRQLDREKQKCSKSSTEMQNLQIHFEHKTMQIKEDYQAKIRQLEENHKEANVLAEIQMKEKCKDIESIWQLKLDDAKKEAEEILKECQAIAEYNIIQCEVEKNKAIYDLEKQKKELEYLKIEHANSKRDCHMYLNENKSLHVEMDFLKAKLEETKKKFSDEIQTQNETINQTRKNMHIFEVTVTKTHSTIEALKRRLLNSDRDVEQLKAELEATEISKLECEEKCIQFVETLETVSGLLDAMKTENAVAVQEAKKEVAEMELQLLEKVECLKNEANTQIACVTGKLHKTEMELQETMAHLHEQQKLNSEAQFLISKSEKEISHLESAYEAVKKQMQDMEAQNQMYTNLKEENAKLKAAIESMRMNEGCLTKEQEENERLRQIIAQQAALIEPFRDQLEAYKLEYSALALEKQDIEKEAKEMGLKYAQLLGHQNQKQKIKYMVDLKTKNFELTESKKELEHQVRMQSHAIEKLKKELSASSKSPKKLRLKGNKENVNSPNHTLNMSSSNGLLRERN